MTGSGGSVPLERQVQRAILRMCGTCFPDVLIHHSAVVKLTGSAKQRGMQMGAMKGDGFKVGFPDLLCLWSGGAAFMEIKRAKGGVVSEDQEKMLARLSEMGWPASVIRSVDEAHAFLKAAGAPCKGELQ